MAAPADHGFAQAEGLGFAHGDHRVIEGLSFSIGPGLTLVRGGDGRGKTTLLRLLAGRIRPTAGRLHRDAPVFLEEPADPRLDATVARGWLAALQDRWPAWSPHTAFSLAGAFGLAPHLDKPMHMLSTGSRRKVGLVAAAASGAALTLLDTPFAALDVASCRVLAELLAEAAHDGGRAWVVADAALPPVLAGLPLAGSIDLGD